MTVCAVNHYTRACTVVWEGSSAKSKNLFLGLKWSFLCVLFKMRPHLLNKICQKGQGNSGWKMGNIWDIFQNRPDCFIKWHFCLSCGFSGRKQTHLRFCIHGEHPNALHWPKNPCAKMCDSGDITNDIQRHQYISPFIWPFWPDIRTSFCLQIRFWTTTFSFPDSPWRALQNHMQLVLIRHTQFFCAPPAHLSLNLLYYLYSLKIDLCAWLVLLGYHGLAY